MKVMSQNQLLEANAFFSEYMSRLEYTGSDDFAGDAAIAARAALHRHAPYLVGSEKEPVQVEAFRCEGVSLDGVMPFEEVAYRGIFRATIGMRETETDASTGLSLMHYGFTVRVEPDFDRVTDPAITECAFMMADFSHIDRIILPTR